MWSRPKSLGMEPLTPHTRIFIRTPDRTLLPWVLSRRRRMFAGWRAAGDLVGIADGAEVNRSRADDGVCGSTRPLDKRLLKLPQIASPA